MNDFLETAWDIFCYASLAYCLYCFGNWFLAKLSPDRKLGQLEKWADKLYLGILGKKEKALKELEDSNPPPNDLEFHFKERCREKIYDLRNLKYVYDKSKEVFKFESVGKRLQIVRDWHDYLLMEKELSEATPPFSDKDWQRQGERGLEIHTRKEVIKKRMLSRLGIKNLPDYGKDKEELERWWRVEKGLAKQGEERVKDEDQKSPSG